MGGSATLAIDAQVFVNAQTSLASIADDQNRIGGPDAIRSTRAHSSQLRRGGASTFHGANYGKVRRRLDVRRAHDRTRGHLPIYALKWVSPQSGSWGLIRE
jgi:hypothetical protein